MQGYGTHFYGEDEYYEGEWYADRRSGWGRMYYTDGTIYEGEWYDDQRNGQGMLRLGTITIKGILAANKPFGHHNIFCLFWCFNFDLYVMQLFGGTKKNRDL